MLGMGVLIVARGTLWGTPSVCGVTGADAQGFWGRSAAWISSLVQGVDLVANWVRTAAIFSPVATGFRQPCQRSPM